MMLVAHLMDKLRVFVLQAIVNEARVTATERKLSHESASETLVQE